MISWLNHNSHFIPFYFAFICYALLSSSTPDHVGWVEIAVGVFLFLGVIFNFNSFLKNKFFQINTINYSYLFIFYMMFIPVMIGVLYGHEITSILRDFIPIIFLVILLVSDKSGVYNAI